MAKKKSKKKTVKKAAKKGAKKKSKKQASKKASKGSAKSKKTAKKKPSKKASKKSGQKKSDFGADEDEHVTEGASVEVGGGQDFDYEILPDDEFLDATLDSYKIKEEPDRWSKDGGMKTNVVLKFALDDYTFTDQDGEEGPRFVWGKCTLSLHEKAKLYGWVKNLLDRELEKGERIELDDLMGMRCRLRLVNATDDKGEITGQFVSEVMKPKGKGKAKAKSKGKSGGGAKLLKALVEFAEDQEVELQDKDDLDQVKEDLGEYAWDAGGLEENEVKLLTAAGIMEEAEEEGEDDEGEEEEGEDDEGEEEEGEDDEGEEEEEHALEELIEFAENEGIKIKGKKTEKKVVAALQEYEWDEDEYEESWSLLVQFGVVEDDSEEEEEGEEDSDEPDLSFLD